MASGDGAQYLPGGGEGKAPQWLGIYYAYVSGNADPTGKFRARLRVPQVMGNAVTGWAIPLLPQTAAPAVGAAVMAMFVGGDPTQPAYLGPTA